MNNELKSRSDKTFWQLWNLSFGFFGVQIAYALQSANISRIFATLGADPHNLNYFWILPPLMGIVVQPIVGTLSDKTWTRFGRRIPYLFVGAAVAVLVMCLLPNAGSLGMTVSTAMVFGLIALMFLDTSINMAMQPFKMLVGDEVNENQKALAYSIQSFLCNAGSLVGYVFPFFFTAIGIANTAPSGVIPDSVIYSFYIGAAILILCVIYTTAKVKEMPPKEYAEYHNLKEADNESKANWIDLLKNAPSTFWEGWPRSVLLVVCLHVYVDLHQRNCCSQLLEYYRSGQRGLSGCRQLGGSVVRCSGCRIGALGDGVAAVQKSQVGLQFFACHRWRRLCHDSFRPRPVCHVRAVHPHWLRLGGYIGHAFHFRHQRAGGLRTHGSLPWIVQWYDLHTPNYCSLHRWSHLQHGGSCSE